MTATVKLFLVFGDPASTRTAEISNWSGKAVAGPRSQLDSVLAREEALKPGVYILSGVNPETGKERVYIGEAESIRTRIKNHLTKDFWKAIVYFVSKDENLTKAHIKYLEGKLIELARKADRFEIDNANASGAMLPESDSADMNVFLSHIEQLLPILGQDFLRTHDLAGSSKNSDHLLVCVMKNARAKGRVTADGFLVYKGSTAVMEERASTQKYPQAAILRSRLVTEGVLVSEDDRLTFAKDYEFSSPSAAASVIHGGQANGLTAWKDSKGISLKQMEEKRLQS